MARLIILFFVFFYLITTGCSNNNDAGRKAVIVKKDSSQPLHPVDIDTSNYDSCHEDFFKGLPRFQDSSSAHLVMQKGKKKSLTQFFRDEFMSDVSQYGIKDLDKDGVPELIIFNYTGGAHCCDEYFFFSQQDDTAFEYKGQIMGGQACIDPVTNIISYSFGETLGYFFTCYACSLSDSAGTFKTLREIQLKFAGGRLQVVPYDTISEAQNLANLKVLQQHGFEKIEAFMDSGWRKEFAINLAIWHYNHGKNWALTKKLFNHYYTFKDDTKVWSEFYKTLMEAGKENSF